MSFAELNDVCVKHTFVRSVQLCSHGQAVIGQGLCPGRSSGPSPRTSPGGPAPGSEKWAAGKGPATRGGKGRLGTRLPELLATERSDNGKHSSPPPPLSFLLHFFFSISSKRMYCGLFFGFFFLNILSQQFQKK